MEQSNEAGLNNNQAKGVSSQMESYLIKEFSVTVNNDLKAAESKEQLEDDLERTEKLKKKIRDLGHELVEKFRNVSDLRLNEIKDKIKQLLNELESYCKLNNFTFSTSAKTLLKEILAIMETEIISTLAGYNRMGLRILVHVCKLLEKRYIEQHQLDSLKSKL